MFFESHRSRDREHFFVSKERKGPGFPLHIHRAFECYAVKNGSVTATINDTEYLLTAGDAVLVFPYQRHEYKKSADAETWVCIFSPDLVGSFDKRRALTPVSNKFKFDPNEEAPDSLMLKKALCYKICGIFDKTSEYTEKNSEKDDLLSKILYFISENYKTECKLEEASRYVGYDYSYISKFFKRMTGQSYKSYVNGLRIGEACRLLCETNMQIDEISEKCGFNTTRTFNREFLIVTGKTPREYRKG